MTEPGHRLPVPLYPTYQSARRTWTAGFCTALSSLAVMGTGVGVLILGDHSGGSLTDAGHRNAMIAGGTLTGLGAAGTVIGSVIYYLGRRDLLALEGHLAIPVSGQGGAAPAMLPTAALLPEPGGGFRFSAGWSGRF